MLVYLSLDIICSSRLTVYHKHPSQKTVRILELVIRRQISVHIFAPNGGYCWQGCFWTLRCFYIYSQGVPRLFQNSDPLSTTRPTKVICLQRRNRRLYDRVSLFRRQQINFSISTDCVCSLKDYILEFSQIRSFRISIF